jgi:hypothetical protein
VVAVQADGAGATSLVLALVAPAVAAGAWAAMVGLADVGLVAAAEQGVDLGRLVLVPRPGARWAEAAAALLDGMDVVVVGASTVGVGLARRLTARVRERGAVLVALIDRRGWPEAEVRLAVEPVEPADATSSGRTGPARGGHRPTGGWEGVGGGYGHLHRRRVAVVAGGRHAAAEGRRVELWLPGPGGRPAALG